VAKNALGRGLDALLGETEDTFSLANNNTGGKAVSGLPEGIETDNDGVLYAAVSKLLPNPRQPRREFAEEALEELAASIREHGIIQPVTVEEAGNGLFYIIAGERRTRAAKLAGLVKIPVQVRKYSDNKKLEIALIENIQREDLNPLEEARAYTDLMELSNLNQEDVAKRVGKKRSTIANAVRLLRLPDDMQQAIVKKTLTAGHARALLSVTDEKSQRLLFEKIISEGVSVRETERFAQKLNAGGLQDDGVFGNTPARIKNALTRESSRRDPDLTFTEQKFIDVLGTKVNIKGDLDKGMIQIDYFSRDDLNRLYEIIVK
jgi:ParB family chromosome partitioning protein